MGFSKSDDDISTVTSSQFTKARLSLATPFILWGLPIESESEVAQSCRTLCNPMDCSLLGSSTRLNLVVLLKLLEIFNYYVM